MPKLISNKQYETLKAHEETVHRLLAANRWLAEFDWLLTPLWDHVLGKTETIRFADGSSVTLMKAGDLREQREKMRDALRARQEEPRV